MMGGTGLCIWVGASRQVYISQEKIACGLFYFFVRQTHYTKKETPTTMTHACTRVIMIWAFAGFFSL
jgi:hypothetical protein